MLQKDINDPLLHKLISMMGGCNMEDGPWIAGGAARRMWFGQSWLDADVDFWFSDPMQFARAKEILDLHVKASELYESMDSPDGLILKQKRSGDTRPIHESPRAITYRVVLGKVTSDEIAYAQIIRTRWVKDVYDLFGYFDFTACNFVTDGKVLMTMPDSVDHVQQRRLVINRQRNSNAPRICPRRVIKYGLYGFHAETDIMRHLIDQIDNGRLPVDKSQDIDDGY